MTTAQSVTTATARPAVPHLSPARDAVSLDDLVADCAEVTRRLAQVPPARPPRIITIPDHALRVVAGLDSYGD